MTDARFGYAEGGIVAPEGFLAAGVSAGLKADGKRDVALIVAEKPAAAAAVFTLNSMAAAPVLLSREHIADGTIRAAIVNAGNANACTGPKGIQDARATAIAVAQLLECEPTEIVVASTGVIGVPLPVGLIAEALPDAVEALDNADGEEAAEAIMTTDTFAKQTALSCECGDRRFTVGGMAKGAGMIMPNMATMLAFVTTDAPLTPAACREALRSAVDLTFHRITIDSDTSTNDMVLLMASGAEGGDEIGVGDDCYAEVVAAIREVCGELARMIIRDGEGATKFVTVTVAGAATQPDAFEAAMSVANSPLVKTALFGGDANWGRVIMAVGKTKVRVDPAGIDVLFAGIPVCRNGEAVPFDERAASDALAEPEIDIRVDLHLGEGEATVWTCDLSYEYVRINGEYRS
jgi:glutamate N-acetyltransferase / amino-acid N-acetyltransferase